jgi:hypothetical protein
MISYSLLSEKTAIKAHVASQLVQYDQLDFSRDLCLKSVENICRLIHLYFCYILFQENK